MNQIKIGKFIQQLRKEQDLTQKELAEKIGVSDKTVSKWETGNGLPDFASIEVLCTTLDITVNEMISGEKLPPANYSEKAEENMKHLLEENEKNKKGGIVSVIFGGLLCFLAIIVLLMGWGNRSNPAWFLDLPSFLELALFCAAIVLLSGCRGLYNTIRVIRKCVLPASALTSLASLVISVASLNDYSALGPNLAIALITPMYALLVYILLLPISYRLENR